MFEAEGNAADEELECVGGAILSCVYNTKTERQYERYNWYLKFTASRERENEEAQRRLPPLVPPKPNAS